MMTQSVPHTDRHWPTGPIVAGCIVCNSRESIAARRTQRAKVAQPTESELRALWGDR